MIEWNLNWPGINPVSKIFSNHGNCFMNTHFINCILIRLKWSIAMLIWVNAASDASIPFTGTCFDSIFVWFFIKVNFVNILNWGMLQNKVDQFFVNHSPQP